MPAIFPAKLLFFTELYTDIKTNKYKVILYFIQISQKFNFFFHTLYFSNHLLEYTIQMFKDNM